MKKIITLYFFMFLFLSFGIKAQDVNNYVVTAGSNESLLDDGGWTQIIGPNQNLTTSAVANIGFEVWFMGERFTQFSVNTNGVLRFGPTPLTVLGNTPGIAGNARICVFAAATASDPSRWATEVTSGEVRYKVTGTAPDRRMVVDWIDIRMKGDATSGTGISRFQAHIYETAPANTNGGVVRIMFGRMYIDSHAPTTGCTGNATSTRTGIGYGTSATQVVFLNTDNHPNVAGANKSYGTSIESCNAFGAAPMTITSLNNITQGSRKFYNFVSLAPTQNVTFLAASCVSDNEVLINWTAAAGNQVGYAIYRSDDNGLTYNFITQVSSVTSNYLNSGLTAGATYIYRVFTVTEGKLSALTANNQVSTVTTISPTVFSISSTNWLTTSTWSTSAVPLSTENVIIGCIVPHTVAVNTNGVANNLTLETNSILNFGLGQSIVTEGNVINNGTINLNNGTLRIKGNLINNAGATVNIQNGTLIVQGNFQNAATATLNGNTGLFRLAGNFTNAGVYNSNSSTMRFDGSSQQLINHTGTSSGQGITLVSNSYNNNAVLTTAAATNTYTNTTDIAISDNSSVSRIITVPTTLGAITNITVDLDIDHNYVGDLIVTLTSPTGTTVTLLNRVPCNKKNINTTLSDAAAASVQAQCGGNPAIDAGPYKPNQVLSAFNTQNPSGVWTLTISDNATNDTGTFRNVNLNITTAAAAGIAIPDNNIVGGLNHIINVPTAGTIQSITMDLGINHTFVGNLIVTLTNPAGTTTRTMMTRVTSGGGTCSGDNLTITFDDLAAASVQTQCGAGVPSINGTYIPNQTLSNAAGFFGQNQQGNWKINVSDVVGNEIGGLMSASLNITTGTITTFPLSSALYYHNLQMQNTGAGVLTQNTNVNIINSATWTNGVFRATNPFMLIFVDNATSTVAINASHADMPVRKIGNDAFNFPVGNGGWGAPIGIAAPALTTDHFTAQYFKQATTNNVNSKDATIHHVGQCEYWILDRTGGASNVVVTLSYDNIRSCTVGTVTGLKVIRWDGAVWRDHFNGGLIATPYTGVLSLGTVNNFSPFTFGASTDNNVLPLTFLSFDAKPLESDAILDWTTTGELNHDYFEIERSLGSGNGQDFKSIGKVKNPIAIDNTKNTYSFVDKNVGIENREAYYRLKQVDTDGTFSYSNVKKVNWSINNSENEALFVAYPNPFTEILTLDFSLDKQENIEIILMDMAGRTIKTISQSFTKGSHKLELNNLQNLARGSYLIQLKTNLTQKTFKVVKM
jgi:subtilisin-like proprotein convertase family protein